MAKTLAFEVRPHTSRPWMSANYHKRIQKKWRKRFGWEQRPALIHSDNRIFCHPDLFDQIVEQIKKDKYHAVV